jgi:hypothetical protein
MKTKLLTLAFLALLITNFAQATCTVQTDEEVTYPKIDLSISR